MIASVQRTIPEDHPAFVGHFPGLPILPGAALLAEAIAWIEEELDCSVVGSASVKFLSPVRPGAVCDFDARWQGVEVEVDCRVGTTTVLRAILRIAHPAVRINSRDPSDPEIR